MKAISSAMHVQTLSSGFARRRKWERSEDTVLEEYRFVEELRAWSVGQAWPLLSFETTGSLPRAGSLRVSLPIRFLRLSLAARPR